MTTLTELKLTMKETGSIREFEFEIVRSAVDKIKMALDSIRNNMEQQEEENKQESVNPK